MHLFDLDIMSTQNQDYPCDICEGTFLSQNILSYHNRTEHSKEELRRPKHCKQCNKEFLWCYEREKKIRFHMKRIHKVKPTKKPTTEKSATQASDAYCKLCDKQFKFACILVTHKKKWHTEEMDLYEKDLTSIVPQFSCDMCSKSFVTKNILNYHTRMGHTKEEKKKSTIKSTLRLPAPPIDTFCKPCKKQFKWACLFNTHKKKWHTKEMDLFNVDLTTLEAKFSCYACSDTFHTQNILNYHQRRNGGSCNGDKRTEIRSKLESPKVTAIVIGTTMDWIMKNKSSMRGQKLRVSHQCVLCYTNFDGITARASLNIHRNKVHKDEVHLLVSAIAKTDLHFTCTFCKLAFISTISRDFHIKSVHEVVSVCPECSNPQDSCRCKEDL